MKRHKPLTIGYLRVSTVDQDLEKNKADILRLANDKKLGNVEWEEEKVTGTRDWRSRKIGEVIEGLKQGDSIITSEFSRLARSTLQILEIMKICKQKGINVHVVKGDWSLNARFHSKVLLLVFSMVSEIERDLISIRTKEALAVRKAQGMKLGRPRGPGKSKLDKHREEIIALLKTGSKQNYIAKRYGCTPGTLTQWLKKRNIDVEPVFPEKAED